MFQSDNLLRRRDVLHLGYDHVEQIAAGQKFPIVSAGQARHARCPEWQEVPVLRRVSDAAVQCSTRSTARANRVQ